MGEPQWKSDQWQQFDQRERETAEFQAIVADAIERDRQKASN